MGEIAYSIDKILWFMTFIIFVSSLFFRLDASTRIALAIWVIGNLIMDLLSPFLMEASSGRGASNAIWYGAWSFINVLCLWCIYKLHSIYYLDAGKFARYVMVCFLALSAIQIIRYADRIVLGTDLLADIYRFGIIAINISVVPAALMWLMNGITASLRAARKGAI